MLQAGVLMAVAALPGPDGIGDFGQVGYEWVDKLAAAGVGIWQILPLNALGYGSSPYQPFSSYALDEIYISLDQLKKQGLLAGRRKRRPPFSRLLDYDAVRAYKAIYLHQAFSRFVPGADYARFISQPWVRPYAIYIGLKRLNGGKPWTDWSLTAPDALTQREIGYAMFLQYQLYSQWQQLKAYANQHGISIMGDVPFYVGHDSADVYYNRQDFVLDEDGHPIFIAGVPPDYFTPYGQRWGNPIYDWEQLGREGYRFWLDRLGHAGRLYDIVRIDHFRAFDSYWRIPCACPTAVVGQWLDAPGRQVLDALFKAYPRIRIVAEDLGQLRPQVLELRDRYKLMGMLVAQFCFDPAAPARPQDCRPGVIFYTGTHDNDPLAGWCRTLPAAARRQMRTYMRKTFGCGMIEGMMRYVLSSGADWAIVPTADLLGLGHKARINTPGTVGSPNWQWHLKDWSGLDEALAGYAGMLRQYGRYRQH